MMGHISGVFFAIHCYINICVPQTLLSTRLFDHFFPNSGAHQEFLILGA